MDEFHGILTAYEMRTQIDYPHKKEEVFKASKKTRKDINNSKTNSNDDFHEEELNSMMNLTRGFGKYKTKLPFKCSNCGKIGHFCLKCPYEKYE